MVFFGLVICPRWRGGEEGRERVRERKRVGEKKGSEGVRETFAISVDMCVPHEIHRGNRHGLLLIHQS